MILSSTIAKHFREIHFGGNWTSVNLKQTLEGVDWQMATAKTGNLHTIAELVFHIHYYVGAVLKVLHGGPLDAHDQYSFDLPEIKSANDWNALVEKCWEDAELFAQKLELLPETIFAENFTQEKYGSYYRNFHGIIEHTHYHLGQIVVLKKIIADKISP